MIQFSRHILDNGLTVICHTDKSTPFVSVNVLYKVGSRNEQADKTGFAHLFEHLMFGMVPLISKTMTNMCSWPEEKAMPTRPMT